MNIFIRIKKQTLVYDSVNLRALTLFLMGMVLIWVTACASPALPENENTGAQENVPSPTASLDIPTSLTGVSILVATIPPTGTPTPGPTPTPSKTPTPRPTITPTPIPSACKLIGQWESYTDSVAGYTLQYPAEAEFLESASMSETYRSISIFLNPSCYNVACWGPTRVVVNLLYNPEELPIREFIEQHYKLYSDPYQEKFLGNYEKTSSFITIAGTESIYIDAGLADGAQPDIFVPHSKKVLRISVMYPGRIIPPYDPPCDKTLELLNQILASIILLP